MISSDRNYVISSRRSPAHPHRDSLLYSPWYSLPIWLGFPIYNVTALWIYTCAIQGPGQLLLFTTSPTSTCADSIHCLTKAIPLSHSLAVIQTWPIKTNGNYIQSKKKCQWGNNFLIYRMLLSLHVIPELLQPHETTRRYCQQTEYLWREDRKIPEFITALD